MTQAVRERIRRRIDAVGINPNVASKRAGLDRSVLRKYLNGNIKSMREVNLRKLAPVLQCTVSYLLDGSEAPAAAPAAQEFLSLQVPEGMVSLVLPAGLSAESATVIGQWIKLHVDRWAK